MANDDSHEVLLAIYEGQRTESLQHRLSIFNAYNLSMAGLLAIAAGAVAPDQLRHMTKWIIAAIVLVVWVSISIFIRSQRSESERGMEIMRRIERHLKLFEEGVYIPGCTVLPSTWAESPKLALGMRRADMFHVGSLSVLAIGIFVLLVCLP